MAYKVWGYTLSWDLMTKTDIFLPHEADGNGGGDESYTGPCNGQTSQYLVFRERYPKYHHSSPAPASLSLKMQRDQLGLSVEGATVVVGVLLCSPSQCGGSPTPRADSPQKRGEGLDHSTGRPSGGPINRL